MPTSPPTACLEQPCPYPAIDRGRCAIHRRSTTRRGYGSAHQAERQAALPGARCERCGSVRKLQRDHRIPRSLGGGEDPANKRWLCPPCHAAVGLKSSSVLA